MPDLEISIPMAYKTTSTKLNTVIQSALHNVVKQSVYCCFSETNPETNTITLSTLIQYIHRSGIKKTRENNK